MQDTGQLDTMVKCSSCKQEGHRCNQPICANYTTYIKKEKPTKKVGEDHLIEGIEEAEKGTIECLKPEFSNPDWYLIPEIEFSKFIKILGDIYIVLEEKNKLTAVVNDPFLKAILECHGNLNEEQWNEMERLRRFQKALEGKVGYLHQGLAGSFKGWRTIESVEGNGLDIVNNEHTEIMEWKNKCNTMNSGSAATVIKKLKTQVSEGKKAFLVMVNCGSITPRFGAPPEIIVMNGQEAYEHLSGRASFFNDLLVTISYVFKKYKTYEELRSILEEMI